MPRGQWESVSTPKWPIWIWELGKAAACAIFILVMLDIASTGLKPQTPALLSIICAGVLFFVSTSVLCAIPRLRERRFERIVRAHQYEVCWNCGYSLEGLAEVHRCPECGTEYDKDRVRRDWRAWFSR